MNKAYIYFNDKNNKEYSGEGGYVLVFDDNVIGNHFCSNRSFANHDLTIWKIEELEKNIKTPDGYKEIKTDKIAYLRKIYIRKFFVNTVPVKAKLYKNITTKEIAYYFEGTPIKQKVLERKK